MILNKELFDSLTAQAKASPRLRIHFDLRNSPDDQSQRMLNAIEPGTTMPIHRHRYSSETVVVLRGKVKWTYYDNDGNITNSFTVASHGDICGLSIPQGQWHTLESLQSGTVILSSKDGAYMPLDNLDILSISNNI